VGGDVWELCHEIAFFPSVRSSRCIAWHIPHKNSTPSL
jgi:hypothetical protein